MNFFKFILSRAFWIQVLLALIITVILGFLAMKWLDHETHHGEKIKVPDLSKMRLDSVDMTLSDLDLQRVVLDSTKYNPDYPKYSVVEQNPKPGKFVKEGRKIYLKLNPSGYPKLKMPNLIRHTKRQVIPVLRSMGFKIGDITYKPDIAKDAVLELRADGKTIAPGDEVMKSTTIDLILGSGPNFKGNPGDENAIVNDSIPTDD